MMRMDRMVAGGDANRVARLLAKCAQRFEFGVDLFETWADGAQHVLARLSRRNTAHRPGQQPDTEPLLQASHGVAEA